MKKETNILLIIILILLIILIFIIIGNEINKSSPNLIKNTEIKNTEIKNTEIKNTEIKNAEFAINKHIEKNKYDAFIQDTNIAKEKLLSFVNKNQTLDMENGYVKFKNDFISFDYPDYWTIMPEFSDQITDKNVKNVIMVGKSNQPTVDIENFRLTIETLEEGMTGIEYANQTKINLSKIFKDNKYTEITDETLNISGRETILRIYRWIPNISENQSPYNQDYIAIKQAQAYVASNNNIYIFTFTTTESKFNDFYKNIILNIIKTIDVK